MMMEYSGHSNVDLIFFATAAEYTQDLLLAIQI